MSHLQYFDYQGAFAERSKREINYSQAVRIDNRIEVSGQGGWDPFTEEISKSISNEVNQAFNNVEHAVQLAGGKMEQVYRVRFYITVPLDDIVEHLVRNMKERFKGHSPLLTCVQVVALYKTMRVEIEAEAHLGQLVAVA
ncbi:hypothetical protein N0V91_010457 [Didymella pomorum]|uniref:YjgF-like protein n=1 Tax=Didymella pomorum TaxID=749634 RepID=A0A9W8Z5G3_9PLEO|nr:hypothetical protein N0V91_010457 [Didymella pomorum]